jgi:hypothetical protein
MVTGQTRQSPEEAATILALNEIDVQTEIYSRLPNMQANAEAIGARLHKPGPIALAEIVKLWIAQWLDLCVIAGATVDPVKRAEIFARLDQRTDVMHPLLKRLDAWTERQEQARCQ